MNDSEQSTAFEIIHKFRLQKHSTEVPFSKSPTCDENVQTDDHLFAKLYAEYQNKISM